MLPKYVFLLGSATATRGFCYTGVLNLICIRFENCARPVQIKRRAPTEPIRFAAHVHVITVWPACRHRQQITSEWMGLLLQIAIFAHLKAKRNCNKTQSRAKRTNALRFSCTHCSFVAPMLQENCSNYAILQFYCARAAGKLQRAQESCNAVFLCFAKMCVLFQ